MKKPKIKRARTSKLIKEEEEEEEGTSERTTEKKEDKEEDQEEDEEEKKEWASFLDHILVISNQIQITSHHIILT